jgi:hypothetical protein
MDSDKLCLALFGKSQQDGNYESLQSKVVSVQVLGL